MIYLLWVFVFCFRPGQVRPHAEFGAHPPIMNTGNVGPSECTCFLVCIPVGV